MLNSGVFLPVVRHGLVESSIFLIGDFLSLTHPDGLLLVKMFPRLGDLLDSLGLLAILLLLIFIDILNLGLVIIIRLHFLIFFLISDFFLCFLLNHELNGKTNKLRVLLNQVLQSLLLKVFLHILLQLKDDTSTTSDRFRIISSDTKRTTGSRLPSVLLIITMLGDNSNLISD